MTPLRFATLLAIFCLILGGRVRGAVVINEIFYHSPEDLYDLQWIELHNTANQPADLGGWSLVKGMAFTFPKGTSIDAGGYVVVARNPARFREYYRVPALGPFPRGMSRGGAKIELLDAQGKRVDMAQYKDRAPWPVSADGASASLERICPLAPGDSPDNWAASPLPADAPKPAGTPEKANSVYSATLPPAVGNVTLSPTDPAPDQLLHVQAEIKNKDTLKDVTLLYRTLAKGMEGPETPVEMTEDPATGRFAADIPAQKATALVRYRIKATNRDGAVRFSPAENDLCPTFSAYVHTKWEAAKIPFGLILHVRNAQPAPGQPRLTGFRALFGGGAAGGDGLSGRSRGAPQQPLPPRGSSAFIYVDPTSGKTTVFDHVNVIPRDNDRGYKVHFHKDQTLNGMSVASVIFEGNERFLLAEYLAYDVYHRAGNGAAQAQFMRLWVDGRMVGYHLMLENPNKSFIRRNKLRDDGNLYKIIWYGNGLEGTHEKRTNVHSGGHEDLVDVVEKLQQTSGDAQWQVIKDNFDVNQVATYFAVNMVLSHWDGYFNNYFTYHDTHGTKKWTMYPWDQDKTWGYHDGIMPGEVFTDMPLTYGMEGDVAPGGGRGGFFGGGNVMWWRRGGYFSRPLLANPQFRKVFLTRVKEILDTVYTKEIYFPLMDDLAQRLSEDVKLRAKSNWGNANAGEANLAQNIELLKTHLVKRREFLLAQDELRALANPPGSATSPVPPLDQPQQPQARPRVSPRRPAAPPRATPAPTSPGAGPRSSP